MPPFYFCRIQSGASLGCMSYRGHVKIQGDVTVSCSRLPYVSRFVALCSEPTYRARFPKLTVASASVMFPLDSLQ